jgi:probable biosynthetic protein (TIGR04098 family)
MVLFGSAHSRYLTAGLEHNASQIVDAKGRVLYPAYFKTHLIVPPCLPLNSFCLWDSISIETHVRRYGDTILDSVYSAKRAANGSAARISMQANSLFILDPSIFRSRSKQVAVPRVGAIRDMEKLSAPPLAIQEAAKVRASGFEGAERLSLVGDPYFYTLECGRDVVPGHPMIFAKIPQLAEFSEREFLRQMTRSKISEEILDAVSMLERKTFYYGNAFASEALVLHTRGDIRACGESLQKENHKLQDSYRITCDTELYSGGELLAKSFAEKVIVHEIRNQSLIQDTKRLLQPISLKTGESNDRPI